MLLLQKEPGSYKAKTLQGDLSGKFAILFLLGHATNLPFLQSIPHSTCGIFGNHSAHLAFESVWESLLLEDEFSTVFTSSQCQVVTNILEGLRSVPSSANTQPWTIVVVQGGGVVRLRGVFFCLVSGVMYLCFGGAR